ncbi:NUDIX domain-containing protein [Spongiactinospora gelatinilytica]|uniref:NUDIX domain-containing protein n=1 Tax=Spongiactinospora gelatinilytica TaxID=2666298 RepID=UPI001314178A
MKHRVRAVAITDDGHLLAIKRIKPGRDPYRVLPDGGVESGDASLKDALLRGLHEELAATDADILALVQRIDEGPRRRVRLHHGRTRIRRVGQALGRPQALVRFRLRPGS